MSGSDPTSQPSDDNYFAELFAIHEARHAVVAWQLGRKLCEIFASNVCGYSKDSGRIDFLLDPDDMEPIERLYVAEEVQILLAGEMADKLFYPEDSKCHDYEAVGGDRSEARFLASKIFHSNSGASEWIDSMEKSADGIVHAFEKAIETLASELVERQKLSGADATNILNELVAKEDT